MGTPVTLILPEEHTINKIYKEIASSLINEVENLTIPLPTIDYDS